MNWFVLAKYYPFAILHLDGNSNITKLSAHKFYNSLLIAQYNQSETLSEYFTTKCKSKKAQKHVDKCRKMKELFPEEFI